MKKQYLLLYTLLFTSFIYAQTGNYFSGNAVTISSTVAPYDGTTTTGAPGSSSTSGDYNTAIGSGAASSLSSGGQTTFIGTAAGTLHTSQYDNVFIGAFAGDQATTGTDNVVIGTRAARTLNGIDNTVIGVEAGMVMTSGASDNVIIGEEAGQALLDGDDNVFIGEDAGFNSTTSSDNTFVGNTAGRQNTTGFANAFFGDEAGYDNTTGQWNTGVGDSALIDNGVGFNNTAVGHGAGCATEHADYNTFVGSYAGGDNNRTNSTSNANRNTYVGAFSGFSNRVGEDNVGMGTFSGYGGAYQLTGLNGFWGGTGESTNRSRTTFIGAQAAADNNDVIAIGYRARVDGRYGITLGNESRAQQNYAVAIGYNVTVNQANTMALGGNTASNRLSVGIGTVAANRNASLDLSDTDKGFLVNRVTTVQRTNMITTPASGVALTTTDAGLMVYDIDENLFYFWNGTEWNELGKTTTGSGIGAVPELLNYQSSIRDNLGNILPNQSVSFRMNIIDITNSNTIVYSETHSVTTSSQGLASFTIGNGTIVSGLFGDIDWSHNNALEVELDVTGGTTYISMGTTSFVSVPYALRAKYAENVTSQSAAKTSNQNKDQRIEVLENEIKELKAIVNKLLSSKK